MNNYIWVGDTQAVDNYGDITVKEYAQDGGFYNLGETYDRTSFSYMRGFDSTDEGDCGEGLMQLSLSMSQVPGGDVVDGIPEDWGVGMRTNITTEGGWDTQSPIGFGFPQDTADGDYDFCFVGINTLSGMRSAQLFRLSIGSMSMWENSRPEYFASDVSEAMLSACAAIDQSCHPNYPDCVLPVPFCEVDFPCPLGESRSPVGRCFAPQTYIPGETEPHGVESAGYDMCDFFEDDAIRGGLQSTCAMPTDEDSGEPTKYLVEEECTDDVFKPACADVDGCRLDPGWHRLTPTGDWSEDSASGYCYNSGGYGLNKICEAHGDAVSFCNVTTIGDSDEYINTICGVSGTAYGKEKCVKKLCEDEPLCAGITISIPDSAPDPSSEYYHGYLYFIAHAFPKSGTGDIFLGGTVPGNVNCYAAPVKPPSRASWPECACFGGAPAIPYTQDTCGMQDEDPMTYVRQQRPETNTHSTLTLFASQY